MKKTVLTAIIAAMTVAAANADVKVNFSQVPEDGKTVVTHILISDLTKSRAERRAATVTDTLAIKGGEVVLPAVTGASQYTLSVGEDNSINFFAAPGENIVIDVNSLNPFEYTMKGTELIDGMQSLNSATAPIVAKVGELRKQEKRDNEALEALFESYRKVLTDFIAANPNSTAVPFAALNLDNEQFINVIDNLSDSAKASIIMPLVMAQYESAQKRLELERKQKALQSGDVDAPAFTLKNPEGKDVSISDFKGKWVILDFWGTWCTWCIKGFPSLKEAYTKYAGKLEIIGIDCGDTEDKWKEGIAKYELPWVQVYKPQDNNQVTDEYFVQGFPTKVIINPEGKVANITVGEDPEFFNTLAKFIGE